MNTDDTRENEPQQINQSSMLAVVIVDIFFLFFNMQNLQAFLTKSRGHFTWYPGTQYPYIRVGFFSFRMGFFLVRIVTKSLTMRTAVVVTVQPMHKGKPCQFLTTLILLLYTDKWPILNSPLWLFQQSPSHQPRNVSLCNSSKDRVIYIFKSCLLMLCWQVFMACNIIYITANQIDSDVLNMDFEM